jgi:hypothetical protein
MFGSWRCGHAHEQVLEDVCWRVCGWPRSVSLGVGLLDDGMAVLL